jgi:hypothetical protein
MTLELLPKGLFPPVFVRFVFVFFLFFLVQSNAINQHKQAIMMQPHHFYYQRLLAHELQTNEAMTKFIREARAQNCKVLLGFVIMNDTGKMRVMYFQLNDTLRKELEDYAARNPDDETLKFLDDMDVQNDIVARFGEVETADSIPSSVVTFIDMQTQEQVSVQTMPFWWLSFAKTTLYVTTGPV